MASHATNWQNAENYLRRHLVLLKLKELCDHLDIQYLPPVQRIELVDDIDMPPSPAKPAPSPAPIPVSPAIKLQPVPQSKKFFSNFDM